MPGATPTTRTLRRERLRQQRWRAQRRLRQRVRQVVRIRIPQLLVEQVDHAARSLLPAESACSACASRTGAATLLRHVARHRLWPKVCALSYSNSDALLTMQADLADFVCALGQQAAHTGFHREIAIDGDRATAYGLDFADGFERAIARGGVVHRDVPAVVRQRECDLSSDPARGAGDESSACGLRSATCCHSDLGTRKCSGHARARPLGYHRADEQPKAHTTRADRRSARA